MFIVSEGDKVLLVLGQKTGVIVRTKEGNKVLLVLGGSSWEGDKVLLVLGQKTGVS